MARTALTPTQGCTWKIIAAEKLPSKTLTMRAISIDLRAEGVENETLKASIGWHLRRGYSSLQLTRVSGGIVSLPSTQLETILELFKTLQKVDKTFSYVYRRGAS